MTEALGEEYARVFAAHAMHVTRHYGEFSVHVVSASAAGSEDVVLTRGDIAAGREPVLCRVSSACMLSTALDSAECDCKQQIYEALRLISLEQRGVVVYLSSQEGRGHGVATKVRALANKNAGMDTFEAVEALGLSADVRTYDRVPEMLGALGVSSIRLLSSNPEKVLALRAAGVSIVEVMPLAVSAPIQAQRHLLAKRARGHIL